VEKQVNPAMINIAKEAIEALLSDDGHTKAGFVPGDTFKAAQPGMDPNMMGVAPPGGAPMPPGGGAPMPPAPPGAPMPPAPPAPPGAPMPPEAGMPPGGAPGGAPAGPEGDMVAVNMEDLVALFEQISNAGTGEGDNEPTTTNVRIGERLERLEGKMDDLASLLTQVMGIGGQGGGEPPAAEGGAMPPEGEIPPDLMAALGGGAPPGMAPEGMPMDPSMAGGMPEPQAMPGMQVQASDATEPEGAPPQRSAMKLAALAMQLRK
jgi:hypothetical protein